MFSLPVSQLLHPETGIAKEIVPERHYVLTGNLSFVPSYQWYAHFVTMPRYRYLPANRVKVLPDSEVQQSGFMFWSVTISPALSSGGLQSGQEGHALVWDTARSVVQARSLGNISHIAWEVRDIRQGDCVTALPDKHHVYVTDYDTAPALTNDWLQAATFEDPRYSQATKYFVVLDSRTGMVLVNYTIPLSKGVNPSLLVPGARGDVFIGTPSGIVRLYAEEV